MGSRRSRGRGGARPATPGSWAKRLGALLLVVASSTGYGAGDEWLVLQAPQFTVISALGERETRRWAGEFDQFVVALHRLYAIDQRDLPPLAIVLFDRPKGFAPYRPVTESGQAQRVDGVFGRRANWSVIGTTGNRGSRVTRRVIYHEAVHWFFSADDVQPPLWFAEGFAEVFSTFEVKQGKGRWGEAIPEHVAYLNQFGLRPLEEFFGIRQDEALHDDRRFYPQAWAFVHFGLFGDGGSRQRALGEFAQRIRSEPTSGAFRAAFGLSLDAGDDALRGYLRRGKYSMAVVELEDRGDDFALKPADALQVELALGRLALATGNTELALRHADALIAVAPQSAEGYEIRALAQFESGDRPSARPAIEQAVRLGSRDAELHLLHADFAMQESYRPDAWLDQALDPAVARRVADSVIRALTLQPRNPQAFELLAIALLNVTELSALDEQWLDAGQRFLPRSGFALLVRACAANRRGDAATARQLLAQARGEGRELPPGVGPAAASLGERWMLETMARALAEVDSLVDLEAFDARLREAMAESGQSRGLREALRRMSLELPVYRAQLLAVEAAEAGDYAGARAHLQSIVDDPDASRSARANAERALRSLDR